MVPDYPLLHRRRRDSRGTSAGVDFAPALLGLLVALSIYAGLYDTVPKMLLKWPIRRAIVTV